MEKSPGLTQPTQSHWGTYTFDLILGGRDQTISFTNQDHNTRESTEVDLGGISCQDGPSNK